jgi:cytochrome P450
VARAPETLDSLLASPETRRDPWPVLARLRREDPVHYAGAMDCWLVTRYDDVRLLFSDPRVTADRRQWRHYTPPPQGTFLRWIDDHGLMAVPPKEHARQRRLLASGFTPRGVARMNRQIRQVVERHAQPLHGRRGVVDIMAEFTTPIPNAVISRITGVGAPGDAQDRFSRLAQEAIQGFFGFVSDEVKERAERSYRELASWVRETIRLRREAPEEDLISDLVHARDGDDHLDEDHIVAQVGALLAAGSETTAVGGMISITTLLDHPDALRQLREDRSRIPRATSEILRYGFGGLGGMQRFAVDDFELHGKKIRKGEMLLLSLGGASHDPDHYPDPERFDIDRDPKDLLTFGAGPHYCLGANLARGELACMIDAALDFLPDGARVLRDQMQLQPLGLFDRVMTCPIDFGLGRR